MAGRVFKVMVSSTFRDLRGSREAVRDAILSQGMLPLMMEHDAAIPDRGIIANSLAKVDEADAYVVLISNYRYGQVIDDATLNPDGLSVTELEFDKAEKRSLPICAFLMDDNVPVSPAEMRKEAAWQDKLLAFRDRANHPGRITATFTSEDDLKGKVIQTLSRLQRVLEDRAPQPPPPPAAAAPAQDTLPAPPTFVARPPYVPGHPFQGRARELALMRDWAASPADPVLVFEAIGGMGKSTVTWEWVTNHAATDRADWAGRLWYSFYERGADMRDFKVTALAYITHLPPDSFRTRPDAELTSALLGHLTRAPFLLVLDGLERVLSAYHRADAAQLRDEDVTPDADTGMAGRKPQDCIRPDDHDLLHALAGAAPSKLLVSSRLMPRALLNAGGEPVPGVRRELLLGLAPEDAEAMLRRAGIKGDGERMRRYLAQAFDCHPLVVGFVAGLVRKLPWARMDFDLWLEDPSGGRGISLTDPDLRQRRTNILELAFSALLPQARELIGRMAILANPANLEAVEALNPTIPDKPTDIPEPMPPDFERDDVLKHLDYSYRAILPNDIARQQERLEVEAAIVSRKEFLNQRFREQQEAFQEHQLDLKAWPTSEPVRKARSWLHSTLIDLEARGLVQWDRRNQTFDLHPIVRSYAIDSLDPIVRDLAGRKVADYFASRPQIDIAMVTAFGDLGDRLQVVQALGTAGNLQQMWDAFWPETRKALHRLERHHEVLAILRLIFRDGWLSPPSGIANAGLIASEAALALRAIGRHEEEEAQNTFSIWCDIAAGLSRNLAVSIFNHYHTARDKNELARASRILRLAREVAISSRHHDLAPLCDLLSQQDALERGTATEAKDGDLHSSPRQHNAHSEALCIVVNIRYRFRTDSLTETQLRQSLERIRSLGHRSFERELWRLAGNWYQSIGDHEQAVSAFALAAEMARVVGLRDVDAEILRGVSLAKLGHSYEAESVATLASGDPPHISLAELNLALGRLDSAREHALAGYNWAWADGPPWCWYWELQRCRRVLRVLNVYEPKLSPYDLTKMKAVEYEQAVRRLLAEHADFLNQKEA